MIEIIKKADSNLAKILPSVKPSSDTTYVPSQFVIQFEYNGKKYLFNNLTKEFVEGSLPKFTKIGDGYDDLIVSQFLVPEEKDECEYYKSISSLMRILYHKKGIQNYTILPTLGCNARCLYCYRP